MTEHKYNCASLTQMLLSMPPQKAPCDCGAVESVPFTWSIEEPMKLEIYNDEPNEWARIDDDLKLTHLDMDLCAKGPANIYTALVIGVWNAAIDAAAEGFECSDPYYCDEIHESIMRLKK